MLAVYIVSECYAHDALHYLQSNVAPNTAGDSGPENVTSMWVTTTLLMNYAELILTQLSGDGTDESELSDFGDDMLDVLVKELIEDIAAIEQELGSEGSAIAAKRKVSPVMN